MNIAGPALRFPDDALLLAAAHPRAPGPRAQIAELIAAAPGWPGLVADAARHGVEPLLARSLRGHEAVPASAREALAQATRHCVARNLLLRHELRRLLATLAEAAADVLPLKGPVLADALYPDPLLRVTADLDILVRPGHAAAAERGLCRAGYRPLGDAEQGAEYHTRFAAAEGPGAAGVVVELHRELGEPHVSRPDVAALWASASRAVWSGQPVWAMAPADEVVYLGFHAAKDGLASLRALLDVTLLLERRAAAWAAVVERARAQHLATPVYLALRESRGLLGAPVPGAVLDSLRPRRWTWPLAEGLLRWRGGVLHAADPMLVGPVMALLMLLWEDAPGGRRRHLGRNLLPSARLRERWTGAGPPEAWWRWYPRWLGLAVRHGARQFASRAREV